jgi:hypothetical protein
MSAANPQEALPFFETAKAATKRALEDAGVNFKTAGAWLWPEKDVERAATDLRAALNENRNEELDTEQHILLAIRTQRYHYVHYVCHRTSHGQPPLVTPEEQKAVVQAEVVAVLRSLKPLLAKAERLGLIEDSDA